MTTWPPPPEGEPGREPPPIAPPPPPPPIPTPATDGVEAPGPRPPDPPRPASAPPPWPPPPPPGWSRQPPPQGPSGPTEWTPQGYWTVPAGYGTPYGAVPASGTNQLCIASMVTGIAGLGSALCCGFFGFIFGIAAIATGIIGLSQVPEGRSGQGRGMAIAGICCGVASMVLPVLLFAAFSVPSWRSGL